MRVSLGVPCANNRCRNRAEGLQFWPTNAATSAAAPLEGAHPLPARASRHGLVNRVIDRCRQEEDMCIGEYEIYAIPMQAVELVDLACGAIGTIAQASMAQDHRRTRFEVRYRHVVFIREH